MSSPTTIRPGLVKLARKASRNGQPLPWTPELAMAVLVAAMFEHGTWIGVNDLVYRYGCASRGTYAKLFGSWSHAKELAVAEVARLVDEEIA